MRMVNQAAIVLLALSLLVADARSDEREVSAAPSQPATRPERALIARLREVDLGDFWRGEKPAFGDSYNMLQRQAGYLGSGELAVTVRDKCVRRAGVIVFNSKPEALAAVEYCRKNVANVIEPGTQTDQRCNPWWFCAKSGQPLLIVVYDGVVVWASDIVFGTRYEKVEGDLWKAVETIHSSLVADGAQDETAATKPLTGDRKGPPPNADAAAGERELSVELVFRKNPPAFAAGESIVVKARFVNRTDKPQVYRGGLGDKNIKFSCQISLTDGGGKAWSTRAAAAPMANYNDITVPAGGQTVIGEWDLSTLVYSEGSTWSSGGKIPFTDIARPGRYRVSWWDGVFQAGTPLRSKPVELVIVQAATLPSGAAGAGEELRLEAALAVSAPGEFLPGQTILLETRLVNASRTREYAVVKPGDGSESGWREPHVYYTAERLTAEGRWTPLAPAPTGRCGLFDGQWQQDIVTLKPGESLALKEWLPRPSSVFEFQQAGRYRIRVHYAYRGGQAHKGAASRPAEDLGGMKGVEPFEIVSDPVEIAVQRPLNVTLKVRGNLIANQPARLSDLLEIAVSNDSDKPISAGQPTLSAEGRLALQMKAELGWAPTLDKQNDPHAARMDLQPGRSVALLGAGEFANGLDGSWTYPRAGTVKLRAGYTPSTWKDIGTIWSDWVDVKVEAANVP